MVLYDLLLTGVSPRRLHSSTVVMLLNSRWVEVRDHGCLVLSQRLHHIAAADLPTVAARGFASVAI